MPNKEGALSQDPVVGWPQQMPPDSEVIQDDSVDRQESLCLSGRLEPSHLPLALASRLVRDFGPIVSVTFRDVNDRRHDGPVCRAVAPQLVGHQPSRFAFLAF